MLGKCSRFHDRRLLLCLLLQLYSEHYGLQDTFRFVVACLTEIPTRLAVALSQGPDQFPLIMSLLDEHPEQVSGRRCCPNPKCCSSDLVCVPRIRR